jgi:ferrous iron transport protein B
VSIPVSIQGAELGSKLASGSPVFKTVAVVGPPNAGKTTLFNRLTGLRQKVGNFPGVTVEHHTGSYRLDSGDEVSLIDLPGVYSLNPKSEDEKVTVDVLNGEMPGAERPDAIILVLDSNNLNRHLILAGRVIALGLPTLVLLNMADELHKQGGRVDVLPLARQLGTPVALVSAVTGEGLHAVQNFLVATPQAPEPLELPIFGDPRHCREWAVRIGTHAAYRRGATPEWTRRLDSIFLHRIWGGAIFAVVIVAVFQTIFSLGQPASDILQNFLDRVAVHLSNLLPPGVINSLIVNGVWKGAGSVLVFLPQILLLFLVIGILEDSGYLARAAVISDKVMAKVGLNGKSFIPLLSAYGCAVPAIMATRTIENKRDRIATILIAPFMTCSARLPVYTMVIAAFIPNIPVLGPLVGSRAAVMLSLYVLGFAMAVLTAKALKSSVLRSRDVAFIMELPPYRWPMWKSLGLRLMDRANAFIFRAGTVILGVSIVLWALTYLPMHNGQPPAIADSAISKVGHFIEPAIRPLGFNWRIGVGLLSSFAAREVIIATMGTLHGVDPQSHAMDLQQALKSDLTPAGAIALLVFFAFAMQCMSTMAVVRRETNSWKWPIIQFLYMTFVAYAAAFVAYRVTLLYWY